MSSPAELTPVVVRAFNAKNFEDNSVDIGEFGVVFPNNGNVFLLLKNDTMGAVDVTIETPAVFDEDLDLDDRVVEVPAEDVLLIGVFPQRYYNDGTGKVKLTVGGANYDDVEAMAFYR